MKSKSVKVCAEEVIGEWRKEGGKDTKCFMDYEGNIVSLLDNVENIPDYHNGSAQFQYEVQAI